MQVDLVIDALLNMDLVAVVEPEVQEQVVLHLMLDLVELDLLYQILL
tara:strand:+ start:362 stop:502 length:141 start_codon:yes stop_codon:yes gene_type:complete